MGGRGGSGGKAMSASSAYAKASKRYTQDYEMRTRGQITRREAGIIYKANKNGDISVKPEMIKELYNGTDAYIRYAMQRYTQDHIYYDNIERACHSLVNNDYRTAQKILNEIENDNIKRAGKKSIWYKYRNNKH